MSEIDFSGLGAQVTEMINSANSGESTSATATPTTSEVPPVTAADGQQAATPASTPLDGQQAPAQQDGQAPKLIEVDLGNGKVEKLTAEQIREAYNNGLRQADYTRKAQEVARQRQEAEAIFTRLQQEQAKVEYLLNNPHLLALQAQQQLAAQQAQQIDPTAPVTMADLQKFAQTFAQQSQQQLTVQQQAAREYVEDRIQVAEYAETINSTLNTLKNEFPILKAQPEFEDILRFRVAQMRPASVEEAQTAFKTIGAEIAGNLEKSFNERYQQRAADKAKLTQTAIEPPGGSAPQPSTPNYRKANGDVDWTKLSQAAVSLTRG